jgi:hypothetical protein
VTSGWQERFKLKHIFCWHSLYGYWAGIAPDSEDMAKYHPKLVWPMPTKGEPSLLGSHTLVDLQVSFRSASRSACGQAVFDRSWQPAIHANVTGQQFQFCGHWVGSFFPCRSQLASGLTRPGVCAGVLDVDPCFAWNCQVVAGVGVVNDISRLYRDMHAYLAGACLAIALCRLGTCSRRILKSTCSFGVLTFPKPPPLFWLAYLCSVCQGVELSAPILSAQERCAKAVLDALKPPLHVCFGHVECRVLRNASWRS